MIFQVIKEEGLNPESFKTIELHDQIRSVFSLRFRTTPFVFEIGQSKDSFHLFDCRFVEFSPDNKWSDFYPSIKEWTNIETIIADFREWINRHIREYLHNLLEPDLWEQIDQGKALISGEALSSEETTPFSDEEKLQLKMSINEFRVLVKETFQPSEEKYKVIDERLEYLSNALDRQFNRIDWRSLALSTLLSISATLSLEPEKVNTLFGLFRQVFIKVIHLLT
jgi:hypothetical protein